MSAGSNQAEFDLKVDGLVYGGSGIARAPDGRAVFIPFVLPGEFVRVRILEEKTGFMKAEIVEVLESSPDRIQPRCRHFGVCGGCNYQHIPYSKQVEIKKNILFEQLVRLGRLDSPKISQVISSNSQWNYRNAIQFHLSQSGRLGFEKFSSHDTLEIQECHLPCAGLNNLWPQLEFDELQEIERIELRQGKDEEILMVLHSSNPVPPEFVTDLPISVVHLSPPGSIILAGDDHMLMQVLSKTFRVSAGAFFQVNTFIAEQLVQTLLSRVHLNNKMNVLDLYCGVGLFSKYLADQVGRCIGIEGSSVACQDYAMNLDDCNNVELYEGAVEEILPNLTIKAELVIVDPPRNGIHPKALAGIFTLSPEQVVYISCNPATLARDAKKLIEAGYDLTETILLDMFPQTYHIESINFFKQK